MNCSQSTNTLPSCCMASELTRHVCWLNSNITTRWSLHWNCTRCFLSRASKILNQKRKYTKSAYLPFLCQSFLQIFYFGFISLHFSLELLLSLLKSYTALNGNKASNVAGIKIKPNTSESGFMLWVYCFHWVSNSDKDSGSVRSCATPQTGTRMRQKNAVIDQTPHHTQVYCYHVLLSEISAQEFRVTGFAQRPY